MSDRKINPLAYEPTGWYWVVAGDPNRVFSSAQVAYVDSSDPDYLNWVSNGGIPTPIATDGELADVFARGNHGHALVAAAGWSVTGWGWVQPLDRADVLFAAGLAITSATAPALDAVYALDELTRVRLNSNVTYINVNGTFPNGDPEKLWPDADGQLHTFQTTDLYMAFGAAVANYIAAVHDWAEAGGDGDLPSQPVEIG